MLEPGRRIISKWKSGHDCEDLEHEDRKVRLDAEQALEVRDLCFLLLLVFKHVVCADY